MESILDWNQGIGLRLFVPGLCPVLQGVIRFVGFSVDGFHVPEVRLEDVRWGDLGCEIFCCREVEVVRKFHESENR